MSTRPDCTCGLHGRPLCLTRETLKRLESCVISHKPSLRQLPKWAVKPYIRPDLQENKAVTIAASFECKEGYVLCADRLMSHGKHTDFGAFAHYEKKVFVLDDVTFVTVICGSGDTITMRAVADGVITKLINSEDRPSVTSALEESLNDVATKLGVAPEVSLVLASVADGSDPECLRADGLIVQPARPVEILGIGETSLIQYLIDSVYTPDLSLKELSALAVFVVYAAKKYCPQYCGGQTDVCVLPRKLLWDPVPMTDDEILVLEEQFAVKPPEQLKMLIHNAATFLQ